MEEILPALDRIYDEARNPTPNPSPQGEGSLTSINPEVTAHERKGSETNPEGIGHEWKGTDQAPLPQGEGTGVGLIRRLQSLRTRVARIRNQLLPAATNLVRKAELQKELALKLAEIQSIESRL